MTHLRQFIRDAPDFPQPGIVFRDIAPLLREHFTATIDALAERVPQSLWNEVDAVAGIESRGFILAAALAERHDKGFVPIRKKGKLPPPVVDRAYSLEYGTGVLEMQRGSGTLILVDDVLATGGFEDVEIVNDGLALEQDIEEPLARRAEIVLEEMQRHTVAAIVERHVVGATGGGSARQRAQDLVEHSGSIRIHRVGLVPPVKRGSDLDGIR